MGHATQVPYKRERIPASRLEIDMLTYQLNEARKELDKERRNRYTDNNVIKALRNACDSYKEEIRQHTEMLARQTKQLVLWKAIAITEAVVCVLYATGQFVM